MDANATTIEAISLMNGSASNLNFVFTNILTNGSIPVTDLSYNWTIPCNLTSGQDCESFAIALLFDINSFSFFAVRCYC